MRAGEFEFRYRFWIILLIFFLRFNCYHLDPEDSVTWLLRVLGTPSPVAGILPTAHAAHLIFGISATLVVAAAWMRTWGTAYLRNEVVGDSVVHAERLVADGPYRYVRNPLYLGTLLIVAGVALSASPVGWLVIVAGTVILLLRLTGREEAFLLEKQGDAYRAYLNRVPRLWPSLRPKLPACDAKPRWGQAWAAEMWMWCLAAGVALFAVTLNGRLFDFIVWGGFIVWIPVRVSMKRRSRRQRA